MPKLPLSWLTGNGTWLFTIFFTRICKVTFLPFWSCFSPTRFIYLSDVVVWIFNLHLQRGNTFDLLAHSVERKGRRRCSDGYFARTVKLWLFYLSAFDLWIVGGAYKGPNNFYAEQLVYYPGQSEFNGNISGNSSKVKRQSKTPTLTFRN